MIVVPKYLLNILSIFSIILQARCDLRNEESVEKLDAMLTGLNTNRYSRYVDDGLKIWEEYEFGSGVGNREELVVTNIRIEAERRLAKNVTKNWQYSSGLDYGMSIGNGRSDIIVYFRDDEHDSVDGRVLLTVNGTILTFKVINLFNSSTNKDDVVVVLCLEYHSDVKLNWYKIVNGESELIWSSYESKRVERLDFFQHNGRNKLLLVNEPLDSEYSTVKVYGFGFIGGLLDFWLCQRIRVPRISGFELCSIYENTYLSVRSENAISLYEFKEIEETGEGLFELSQNLTSDGVRNSACFESGYTEYLMLSGREPALLTFAEGEFVHDKKIGNLFDDLGETLWVEWLPVETYREECLVLIQLKNLTVVGLTWRGQSFRVSILPQLNVSNLRLSEITVIPKYGFVFENNVIKVETMLRASPRPVRHEMEEILRLKNSLEETFSKQEILLDETERRIKNSYYANPVVTGFWNLSEVNNEAVTISTDVSYDSVFVGSKLFDADDIAADLTAIDERLTNFDETIESIKLLASLGVPENSPLVNIRGILLRGGINVLGTLHVNNLTLKFLNDFSIDDVVNDFVKLGKEGVIGGRKSFPSIESDNIKIMRINDVPLNEILFDADHKNYENIDFSALDELVVNGSLNCSGINGFGWDDLMKRVVWKNRDTIIPGSTVVLGEIAADNLVVSTFNGLRYPDDYVLQEGTDPAEIVGNKTFDNLKVGNLNGIKSINGIPYEDFVKLNEEQRLPNVITFENLIIDECLQVDGAITGIEIDREEQQRTLINNNVISAETMFTDLQVTGNIIVEDSVNGKNLSDFDDIVRKSDKTAVIYGRKSFLGDVQIENKLIVRSRRLNGQPIDEFATINGEQIFSNLKRISAPVTFERLEYKQLTDLENYFNDFVDDDGSSNSQCWDKKLTFNVPPIFESIAFRTFNKNLSVYEFPDKFLRAFENVNFETLEAKTLYVGSVTPAFINDVEFSDFSNRRISISKPQILSGNYTVKRLKAGELKTNRINGMSMDDLERFRKDFENLFDRIWNGKITIDTFIVKGQVETNTINGEPVAKIYANDKMRNVIVGDGFYVKDLQVRGLVNGRNLTEYVLDSVYKSDRNVLITGQKIIDAMSCKILEFPILNGSPIEEILDPNQQQTLSGSVLVNGNVVVTNSFDCGGKVNDIVYEQLIDRIDYLTSDNLMLRGDFRFSDDVTIENLHVDGRVQGIEFEQFLDSVIFQGDDVDVSGKKIFANSVTFEQNFTIGDEFNGFDLGEFNHRAVLIDEDIRIGSEIVFQEDLLIAGDLTVEEYLDSETISNIDVKELRSSAIFLDRPSYVQGTLTFENATFGSDMTVHRLNDVDLDSVISLTEDQIIVDPLLFINASVESLELTGTINSHEISEIFAKTFTLNGNQTIAGNLTFLGNVRMQNDFYAEFINGIDASKMISLDDDDVLIGTFEFEEPMILRKDLKLSGYVNEIELSVWESEAIYDTFPIKQLSSGNWYVQGNVTFEQDVLGGGSLDGVDVRKLSDNLEIRKLKMESLVSNVKMDLESTCQDLTPLQKYAKNQVHRFKYYEYFQIINFDWTIKSVHNFEANGMEFLMINLERCFLNVFVYNGTEFKISSSESDFDCVEKWITLTSQDQVYFLTIGNGVCGKSVGNLWTFEDRKLDHILDLGSVTDAKKIGDHDFLLLFEDKLEKWSIRDVRSGTYGKLTFNLSTNEHMKFIPNTERALLVDGDFVHELNPEYLNHTSSLNYFGNGSIMSLQAGISQTEMFLYYDEGISENNAFIFDGMSGRRIRQSISTHKPKSFLVINFDSFVETFLTFVKNGRSLEIFEYRGIEGFVYRESIKMQIDKTYGFKFRKHSGLSKINYIAAIRDNTLTIMEAQMYGEKLDMEYLTCEEH